MAEKAVEDPLVAKAFDADKHIELAQAIEQLDPEEAAFFLAKLERAITKRKIQISGYLAAMVVWLVGMMFALVYYGMASGFVGWVFLARRSLYASIGLHAAFNAIQVILLYAARVAS